jgi:AcrR family transcriptional regulator
VTPFDDLTARARIREAAMRQFAEHGFERTTVRGIAAEAGVSPGLVRHHFGSKQGLRDAIDAHVVAEIRRINDEIAAQSDRGDLSPSMMSREAMRPFQAYLSRALLEGSHTLTVLFDQIVDSTEVWFARADAHRADPPTADAHTRAAVFAAMVLGVPLLRDQVSRVLGVDILSPEGDQLLTLAMLEIYSHSLISPDLAATARAAMDAPTAVPEESP